MADPLETTVTIPLSPEPRTVSALLDRPDDAEFLYVCAHGAGAGMHHRFMQALTEVLVARKVAVFRYQFPYMESGSRRPDHARTLTATVRAAVDHAHARAGDLPMFAGGKSMGGRMTSRAIAEAPLGPVRGVIFIGFPLHPAGKPGTTRATHLADVSVPMLFVNGTRDKLADLELLRPVCDGLGSRVRLHVLDGADHGFAVLKRSGRTEGDVMEEIGDVVREWMGRQR